MMRRHPDLTSEWLLPVVAETWDGYLNDINGRHVRAEHAVAAIDAAAAGPVEEGAVGGGTGMNCYGFKGGSGTASRRVTYGVPRAHRRGVHAGQLRRRAAELVIDGVPVGQALTADDDPRRTPTGSCRRGRGARSSIVATDAPLLPGQCKALTRRVPLGLARTGTTGSHFSGDIFLAFSSANHGRAGQRDARGRARRGLRDHAVHALARHGRSV